MFSRFRRMSAGRMRRAPVDFHPLAQYRLIENSFQFQKEDFKGGAGSRRGRGRLLCGNGNYRQVGPHQPKLRHCH